MKEKIYLIKAVHYFNTKVETTKIVLAESNYETAKETCKKFNEKAESEKSNYLSTLYVIEECNLYR